MKRLTIVAIIGMFVGLTGIANADTVGRYCYWAKQKDYNDTHVSVQCAQDSYVVSGGCYSSHGSAVIEDSHPFEDGDVNDQVDGDWASLSGLSGWRCRFDINGSTIVAVALCCDPE